MRGWQGFPGADDNGDLSLVDALLEILATGAAGHTASWSRLRTAASDAGCDDPAIRCVATCTSRSGAASTRLWILYFSRGLIPAARAAIVSSRTAASATSVPRLCAIRWIFSTSGNPAMKLSRRFTGWSIACDCAN